ncbi:hypothetical protein SLS62_009123 [Diatrype stigma]|uniref:Uncharacterized protein n=1 Tax=Diatrype stigma TaxID=117547 RepID=A0AAN9UHN8_9PEZI
MQAELLQDTTERPLKIGGYAFDDKSVITGQVFQKDVPRYLGARALHHGGVIGVWVSTIADQQHHERAAGETVTSRGVVPDKVSRPNGFQNYHGSSAAGNTRVLCMLARRPNPVNFAIASMGNTPVRQESSRSSVSASPAIAQHATKTGSSLFRRTVFPTQSHQDTAASSSSSPRPTLLPTGIGGGRGRDHWDWPPLVPTGGSRIGSTATDGAQQQRCGQAQRRWNTFASSSPQTPRSTISSPVQVEHQEPAAPFPFSTTNTSSGLLTNPNGLLPAGLAAELPAFRRAALAYASSSATPSTLRFPTMHLREPARPPPPPPPPSPPPGRLSPHPEESMRKCGTPQLQHQPRKQRERQQRGDTTWFASTPVLESQSYHRGLTGAGAEEDMEMETEMETEKEKEEEKDPYVWGRSLHALLADQPNQAGGVFVNGLVLRGGDLPRLTAVMTSREAEILYVVHPWMGEPVAYM